MNKLTVWYNSKCPVCNAGIDWQRNRLVQAARAGAIEFRDINAEPDALPGIGVEDIRRRLHGRDAAGQLFVGFACAVEIWRRTPGDGWLAWIGDRAGPAGRFGYDRFADFLYAWNLRRGHWLKADS
jgi:predicted DCC family thiol-disulfide oxidoreductase YuxK